MDLTFARCRGTCADDVIIGPKKSESEPEAKQRRNSGSDPKRGSAPDAAVAVADGDHDAIAAENGVGAAQPLGRPDGGRVSLREARAGLLVPEEDLDAVLVGVALAAVVEQRLEVLRPDAALLHAGPGVGSEELHDGAFF